MAESVLDHKRFILLNYQRGSLLCEFVLNNGFHKGVERSVNYHFHSFYEVHIPVSGNLHILVEDKDIFLKPGMICVIPPNSVHYVFHDENAFRISYRFQFSYRRNEQDAYLQSFSDAYEKITDVAVLEDSQIYQKYISVAIDNLLQSRPEFMIAEPLFLANYEIALLLNQAKDSALSFQENYSDTLLAEDMEDFFNYHYNQAISIADLAAYLKFSKRHTERIMQNLFGMSFQEMLNKKRLEAAKLLLRISDLPITEIAQQVGYSDQNYFYRKFSSLFGITPGKYRTLFENRNIDT